MILPIEKVSFEKFLAFCCMNTLGSLVIRIFYKQVYKCGNQNIKFGFALREILKVMTGGRIQTEANSGNQRINITIIGVGAVDVVLAEDILKVYARVFINSNQDKVGRDKVLLINLVKNKCKVS